MTSKSAKVKQDIKPIYVISGKDKFLLSSQCETILDDIMPAEQRSMSLYQPQADKADIADVLDELRTLPFLADRRVVLIKDADQFVSRHRPALEKYFEAPCRTGVLILVVETWIKSTKLAKKLPRVGQHIAIDQIKPWQFGNYAQSYARDKHGKGFERGASDLLVELAGDDPGRLCSEVDKLAIYVGSKKNIAAEDVEKLTGHNRMFNAFAVIDAMTAHNTSDAIGRLRNMFASDKNAGFTIVGAFAFHFRRMFRAKAMLQDGLAPNQVAGKLRIWGNKDAFFAQVNKISLEKIGGVLGELARIDYGIKTGQKDAKGAIEQLVLKLN